MSTYIRGMADLITWIQNTNPGNVLAEEGASLPERLAEGIREWDGRPAWGSDWGPWLDEHAESILSSIVGTNI